jgi:phosphopantetheinyl transferase
MSPIRAIAQRVVERLAFDGGKRSDSARPHPARERRSPARPVFAEGWQKHLARICRSKPNIQPRRSKSRVDIWVASTDGIFRAKSCFNLLTESDWDSLLRIQDPGNRNSAIAARILLRLGLSKATERSIAPAEWQFAQTEQQRPTIAAGLPQIRYSVSHVDELAVVAISPDLNVGIDVESIDQRVSHAAMKEFCHTDELSSAQHLGDAQKIREFVRVWTLKEAYTKLRGVGHSLDFKMLRFTLDPSRLACEGANDGAPIDFENFYVTIGHTLFHASLAIENLGPHSGDVEIRLISLVDHARQFACMSPTLM